MTEPPSKWIINWIAALLAAPLAVVLFIYLEFVRLTCRNGSKLDLNQIPDESILRIGTARPSRPVHAGFSEGSATRWSHNVDYRDRTRGQI